MKKIYVKPQIEQINCAPVVMQATSWSVDGATDGTDFGNVNEDKGEGNYNGDYDAWDSNNW